MQGSNRAAMLVNARALLIVPVVAGLVLRLREAWADIEDSIVIIPDDAFYYFGIARNIANGHNVSFDGETLTNGFHPLWAVLLTPIYFFVDDRELAVHIGLTMGALLGVGAVALVYAAVVTLTDNRWAALAGATFVAIHPNIVVHSVNGMESALTVFMVALTAWLFLRLACRSRAPSRTEYVWLGVSAGFMVLARTDMVFLVPPLLLYFVARERGWPALSGSVLTGGAALLIVAPWLIWSLVTFGTVVQVSGVAVPDINRQAFLDANGSSFSTQLDRSWDVTSDTLFDRIPRWFLVPGGGPTDPLLIAGAAAVGLMLLAPFLPQRNRARHQLGLLAVPASGLLAMLVFHTAVRWHVRDWYYAPVALIAAITLGVGVAYVDNVVRGTRLPWGRQPGPASDLISIGREREITVSWRAWALAGLYASVALALIGVYGPTQHDRWVIELPHRQNMLEAARWLEANTDAEARIGSFNAGIIGYFSQRTVVNLDGVVNEDAYHARRDGYMVDYVCGKRIQYLADLELSHWVSASCDDDPAREFALLATIGKRLFYFNGGQVDVLQLVSGPASVQGY